MTGNDREYIERLEAAFIETHERYAQMAGYCAFALVGMLGTSFDWSDYASKGVVAAVIFGAGLLAFFAAIALTGDAIDKKFEIEDAAERAAARR